MHVEKKYEARCEYLQKGRNSYATLLVASTSSPSELVNDTDRLIDPDDRT